MVAATAPKAPSWRRLLAAALSILSDRVRLAPGCGGLCRRAAVVLKTDQQRHVAWSLRMKNARAQRVALSSPRSGTFSKILASRRRRLTAFFMTREGVGVFSVKNQCWPTRRDTSNALVGQRSTRLEGSWATPGFQEADPGGARVGVPAWAVEEPSSLIDLVVLLSGPWGACYVLGTKCQFPSRQRI